MNTNTLHAIVDVDMRLIPIELLSMIPGKSSARDDFRPRVEYNLGKVIEAYRTCMNNPGMRQSKEDEIMELLQRVPHDVLSLPKVQTSLITFHVLLIEPLDFSE
jgi:hypothetical protein